MLFTSPLCGGKSGAPVGRRNLLKAVGLMHSGPWLVISSISSHCLTYVLLALPFLGAEQPSGVKTKFVRIRGSSFPTLDHEGTIACVGEDRLGSSVFLTFLYHAPEAKALNETRCPIPYFLLHVTSSTLQLPPIISVLVISTTALIEAFLFWVLILNIFSFHGDITFLHSKSVTVQQCENKDPPQKWLTLAITKQHFHQHIGPLCHAPGLIAKAKLSPFFPNLRDTFHARPGGPAHIHKSISGPCCFNYCTAVIIESGGNYGNIIPRINTTI